MGYTTTAVKGVAWTMSLRAVTRVVAFIKTIILARILVPSQFGAYGIALLLISFLEVMTETGVNVLLIQEEQTDRYIDSAWIVSIIRGIIISLIIIILTPFIASFFHSPQSTNLLYISSLIPFLRGFINPSVVKFQKELTFNKEFWYRFSIFLLDAIIAISLSIILRDPTAIIIGMISGAILEVILSFFIIKPLPRLKFHPEYLSRIFNRGKWVTASGIFNYLFHNADNIVVGRILGTASLGIYQMAYSLSILPITEIADVFSKVTFPVYTKISGDRDRLRKAFIKTQLLISALSIPFGAALFIFPNEVVTLILGKRWLEISTFLPILAIFGIMRAISGSVSVLFLAVGKQEYVTVITLISIVGLIVPIIPLIQNYGLIGTSISVLIGASLALPSIIYYIIKIFPI